MNYILHPFKKYATFKGRAGRKEFWIFFFFLYVVSSVFIIIDTQLGTSIDQKSGVGWNFLLFVLVVLIPYMSISIRRLHDIGAGGWVFLLFVFFPMTILVLAKKGQEGENKYGPNPLDVNTDLMKCKACGEEIDKDEKVCPHCGKTRSEKALGWLVFIVILFVIMNLLVIYPQYMAQNESDKPKDLIILNDFSWEISTANKIQASYIIENNSDSLIKDIKITCNYHGKSETIIGSHTQTIYDILEANSIKAFNNLEMGYMDTQIEKASCYIEEYVTEEPTEDSEDLSIKSAKRICKLNSLILNNLKFDYGNDELNKFIHERQSNLISDTAYIKKSNLADFLYVIIAGSEISGFKNNYFSPEEKELGQAGYIKYTRSLMESDTVFFTAKSDKKITSLVYEVGSAFAIYDCLNIEKSQVSSDIYFDSDGRIWQDNRKTKTLKLNQKDAENYCENLTLEDYSDWRLPSEDELKGLQIDKKYLYKKNRYIQNIADEKMLEFYWSSSKDESYPKSPYISVNLMSGESEYSEKTYMHYVRCVRSAE